MPGNTWDYVFLAGFVVYLRIRHVFASRSKGEEKAVKRIDGLEKRLPTGVKVVVASMCPIILPPCTRSPGSG